MSININIITHSSNKTYDVIDMNNEIITTNLSNEIVKIPYDNSYIFYIEPYITEINYLGFLNLTNGIFTGVLGYIWIIAIGLIFFTLIRMMKKHV